MKHYDLETSTLGPLLVWSQGCAKVMFPQWFATVFFNLDRSFSHLKEKFPPIFLYHAWKLLLKTPSPAFTHMIEIELEKNQ